MTYFDCFLRNTLSFSKVILSQNRKGILLQKPILHTGYSVILSPIMWMLLYQSICSIVFIFFNSYKYNFFYMRN